MIDLKKLSMEELVGVVNLYPWFGSARKELCLRMSRSQTWDGSQYADAALYVPSREVISEIARSEGKADCSDSEIEEILRRVSVRTAPVRATGADYFSQEQYDRVRRREDSIFSDFVTTASRTPEVADVAPEVTFCTEALAQIYADQGYYAQAKEIYAKLILAYPEKNAYFAALIEKLNENERL